MDKIQNWVSNVSNRRKGTSLGVVQQLPVLRVERQATERVRRAKWRERERAWMVGLWVPAVVVPLYTRPLRLHANLAGSAGRTSPLDTTSAAHWCDKRSKGIFLNDTNVKTWRINVEWKRYQQHAANCIL